jgi:hypothetical protein
VADRILRDEIWESERFLDLATDTQRLAFVRLISLADDFGNLEGGSRRLFRIFARVMLIKTPEDSTAILSALSDADLIRFYTIKDEQMHLGERELIHIPRFKVHRQYLARKVPASPWCDPEVELGKSRRVVNQGLAKNVVTTSLLHSNDIVTTSMLRSRHVAEGVGVGVGVGNTLAQALRDGFENFWRIYPRKKAKGTAEKAWAKLKPSEQLIAEILSAVERATTSVEWTKERGQFIPYPATWLNARGWQDEISPAKPRILV